MTAKDILAFQFGRADAIRTVASSSSAIWTGMVLVLLTAFARNYDQTYIPEKPFLWFFGPLLFSLVSGTWLFLITYGLCARLKMPDVDYGRRPPLWQRWPAFMGSFWMTAPIAWLYAIPVERFFDSLTAAKANIALLAIVSLWRVLLMARVFQVVTCAPYIRTLLWVLLAAFVEVLVITFFGGAFSKSLLASMGGMRNSPEEDLMLNALGFASMVSLWGVPAAALILGVWRWVGGCEEWPSVRKAPMNWGGLSVFGAFWLAVSVPAQMELRRNFAVEQHVANGDMRAAINYLSSHDPEAFAPARRLPPMLYERTAISEVPKFVAAVQSSDAAWIQQHALAGADVLLRHYAWPARMHTPIASIEPEAFLHGMVRWDSSSRDLAAMLRNLESLDRGREWLLKRSNFLEGLEIATVNAHKYFEEDVIKLEGRAAWYEIGSSLRRLGYTNATLRPPPTSAP